MVERKTVGWLGVHGECRMTGKCSSDGDWRGWLLTKESRRGAKVDPGSWASRDNMNKFKQKCTRLTPPGNKPFTVSITCNQFHYSVIICNLSKPTVQYPQSKSTVIRELMKIVIGGRFGISLRKLPKCQSH